MSFFSYCQFLLESDSVKLKKDLREYHLYDKGDGKFEVKNDDFYKEFSVLPYKSEIVKNLHEVFHDLIHSIETLHIKDLYSAVTEAEKIPYDYGKVFQGTYTLKEIPDLSIDLDDDQIRDLANSENDFLLNNFSRLNKDVKDSIIDSLRERAEIYAIVIEAMFYYIRTEDKDNHYDGMNSEEILHDYKKIIEESKKTAAFSIEGPFSDIDRNPIRSDSEIAIWKCLKNNKEFFIKGTIKPTLLYSEDKIGNTKGLKLSIFLEGDDENQTSFSYFNMNELTKRLELFFKKRLK